MSSQNSTLVKIIEKEKINVVVTNNMASPEMAGKQTAQGLKRRLSISPSLDTDCITKTHEELKRDRNVQATKRRVFSFISSDKFELEHRTGNDPVKGHVHTGNTAALEASRSESNMAAPTKVNKPGPNEPLQEYEKSHNIHPNTLNHPKISQSNGEQREPQTIQPSLNDSIEISDDSIEIDEIVPKLDDTVKNKMDKLSLKHNSPPKFASAGKANTTNTEIPTSMNNIMQITSNSTQADEGISKIIPPCPSTQVDEDASKTGPLMTSPSGPPSHTTGDEKARNDQPDLPSNIDIGPSGPPSLITDDEKARNGKPDVPSNIDIENTEARNNVPTMSQTSPLNASVSIKPHQKTESLLTRLRAKTDNKTNGTPKTSCKDCMMCTDCNKQTENKNKPKPKPKPSRGRGRPRKTVTPSMKESPVIPSDEKSPIANEIPNAKRGPQIIPNIEQVPQDFRSLLMEIKGEVSTVNIKQEACKEDLKMLMNVQMNDFKENLGNEIKNVKEKIETTTAILSDLQESQVLLRGKIENVKKMEMKVEKNSVSVTELKCTSEMLNTRIQTCDEKMITLRDITCDLEIDMIKQKKGVDQANQALSQQISEVEHSLAAHIETVKNNVEAELGGAKQIQMSLENRLANFTLEIKNQNDDLKNKMENLQGDLEQLKEISDRDTPIPNSPTYTKNVQTKNSPLQNPQENLARNSCQPNPIDVPNIPNPFYMYGDTSRALIIDGIHETKHENLREIISHCVNEIGVQLAHDDIEDVFRIGKSDTSRQWPRPIKLILKDQTKRDQIFIFKARLRFSHVFKNARVNKEQRKDIRIGVAKLRQAGQAARRLGHVVEMRGQEEIKIDGITYNTYTLHEIPQEFMQDANQIKNPPPNTRRMSLFLKCTTSAQNVIMVGPSMQKTPYGLAFFSFQSFLSNFYKCDIFFRGNHYTSVEQGYQCIKAKLYGDTVAFDEIYRASSPAFMKQRGKSIKTDQKWDEIKLRVMEDLLFAKFRQNKQLYYSLLNTRPLNLIEATLSTFWGAGCSLGSIALEERCWQGKNHLGKLLKNVRDVFVRELEIGQGSIQ